jgi:hypothetical protein
MIGFHDEEDGGGEPVRGFPQRLPEGERLLWQGSPDIAAFAVHVFHIRFVFAYFLAVGAWRATNAASSGSPELIGGILMSALAGLAIGGGLILVLAWAMARSTVYSITSRRVVLRYGVAIRKYVNLPFERIASADFQRHGAVKGDVQLVLSASGGLSYLRLWPHARPLRFARPRPVLRCLKDVTSVSRILAGAIAAYAPDRVSVSAIPARETASPSLPPATAPSLS